jgi:hypothetical protein
MKPLIFSLTSILGVVAVGPLHAAAPPEKHLLLDSRVVETTEGVALRLGRVAKHPANPLFSEDQPWEVRFDNLYANVVFDEKDRLYRCWYSPFIVDPPVSKTPAAERAAKRYRPHDREMGVCYAESRDGLRWEKPALGLVGFDGNTRNNIVVRGPHGAGVLFDPLDADAARRFKMFCRASDQVKTMAAAFSPDGLRWSDRNSARKSMCRATRTTTRSGRRRPANTSASHASRRTSASWREPRATTSSTGRKRWKCCAATSFTSLTPCPSFATQACIWVW